MKQQYYNIGILDQRLFVSSLVIVIALLSSHCVTVERQWEFDVGRQVVIELQRYL